MDVSGNIFFDLKELRHQGKGSIIGKTVRVRRPNLVSIGRNSIIDDFTYISCELEVGRFTHIAAGCHFIGGANAKVTIGDFVNIGPGCQIVAGQNDYRGGGLVGPAMPKEYAGEADVRPVRISDHVLFGCGVVILPGVELPEGVSAGAYTMLKDSIKYKPWTLYAGIPAREIGKRDGTLMKEQAQKALQDKTYKEE